MALVKAEDAWIRWAACSCGILLWESRLVAKDQEEAPPATAVAVLVDVLELIYVMPGLATAAAAEAVGTGGGDAGVVVVAVRVVQAVRRGGAGWYTAVAAAAPPAVVVFGGKGILR